MRVSDFYNQYINGGYDIDGAYGTQCVDLFKIFCNDLWGTFTACPSGYADSYFTCYGDEEFIQEHFDRIEGTDFQNGDWVCFPYGSDVAPYSHICMYYNGQAFGCNQNGVSSATLIDIDWSQACGALRPKDVWEPEPQPEPTPEPSADCQLSAGTLQCVVDAVNVRTQPSTDAEIVNQYENGMTVNITDIVHTNGYYWGHYVSYGGEDHYVALQSDDGYVYWSQAGYANEIHEGDIVTPTSRVNANGVECDDWVLNGTFTVGAIDGDKCELLNNGVLTDWWKLADLRRD